MERRSFFALCARLAAAGLLLPNRRAVAAALSAGRADDLATRMPAPPPRDATADADTVPAAPDLVLARGDAREATLRALAALGGMERFVKPGQVVVVKPNASFPKPARVGATTNPEVLTAVLEACFRAEARRVLVIDHTMSRPEHCFEVNGTAAAVAAFPRAKLVSLDREEVYRPVDVPQGKALHRTDVPAALQKADVFVNLPTAKSHTATGVSLGLKNLMGLVWDRRCFHQDMDLHQGIADLATVLVPQLTVLDATILLKTGGPTGPGETEAFGGVVAGVDPVAVDAYGVTLSSWDGQLYRPREIAYLRYAAEHGLGTLDLDALRIADLG